MAESNPLRQFLVYVFVLLIPCFALWTIGAGLLAMPATGFANTVLNHWFPEIVDALYVDGERALLMTHFGEKDGRPVPLAGAEYQFGFALDTRILSYSLPFYTALHFATPREQYFNAWILGLLALYPLIALGMISVALKEMMVGLGTVFFAQPGWVPGPNLIGIAYQISVLLVPTLAPVILWLWQSRKSPLLADVVNALPRS